MAKTRFSKKLKRFGRKAIGGRRSLIGRAIYGKRKRSSSLPARLQNSKRIHSGNLSVLRALSKVGETKLNPLADLNFDRPDQMLIAPGQSVWAMVMVVGNNPSFSPPAYKHLDGTLVANGTQSNERIGEYVFLKRATQTIAIECNSNDTATPLMEFRVMQVKSRRGVSPAGISSTPATDLFLDQSGESYGMGDLSKYTMDYFQSMINKRNWVVYKDRKFILTATRYPTGNMVNSKYPSQKSMRLTYPWEKRVKYSNISNRAQDINTTFYTIILCRPVGGNTPISDNWTVSSRGTATWTDI